MAPAQAFLLKQVERLQEKPDNKTCAECCQRDSCWASIIHAPVKGGVEMGVFVCGRCFKHHSALGNNYVVVKSLSQATPWTEEEVRIFEKTGNKLANAIFESKLDEADRNTLKEIITTDRKEEAEARLTFITKKYQHLKYFCEKEYKRNSARITRAGEDEDEEEEEDDDPDERVRNNRRTMLLGGSLSVRNLPSRPKAVDNLASISTHSTRSNRTSRAQAVMNRASSQRNLAMRKSNSDRDLMGRLNSISLGPSPSPSSKQNRDDKQAKMESSSTNTAETEVSESSEEQDLLPPPPKRPIRKSASMDERPATKSLMAENRQSSESPTETKDPPPKGGMRKSSSMDESSATKKLMEEYRQNSLKDLRKSMSKRNLSALSMQPARSSSSRNLMQLPSALQINKVETDRKIPSRGLRKTLSARNVRDRGDASSGRGPGALKKSLSGRSLGRPGMGRSSSSRSLQKMKRSSSGRSLLTNDEDQEAGSPCGGPPARSQMRKSFSGKPLKRPNAPLRKSFSGRSLSMNGAPEESKSTDERNNIVPRGMVKTLSSKDLQARGSGPNNQHSPGRMRPQRANSMRNLLGAGGNGAGRSRPGMRKSFSGRLSVNDGSLTSTSAGGKTNPSPKGMRRSYSKKDLARKQMDSILSANPTPAPEAAHEEAPEAGDEIPNSDESPAVEGNDERSDNQQPSAQKKPTRTRSVKNLLSKVASSAIGNRPGMRKSFSGRSLANPISDKDSNVESQGVDNLPTRKKPARSRSMRGLMGALGTSSSHRDSATAGGLTKSRSFRGLSKSNDGMEGGVNRRLSGTNLLKDGLTGGPKMERAAPGRNLLRDNPEGGSDGRNIASDNLGGGSDHSLQSAQPPRPKASRREKSILVRELDAATDTLCPSRRDLYDPEAKGLALLMQDSERSMMGLSFSGPPSQFNFRNVSGPLAPFGQSTGNISQRYSSPTRPGRSGDAVGIIEEESEDDHDGEPTEPAPRPSKPSPRRVQSVDYSPSRRDSEGGAKRPSHLRRRYSTESPYDPNRSRNGEERDRESPSRRESGRLERRRSRSPMSRSSRSGRDSLGGSSSSNHRRHSDKGRRRSDGYERRGSYEERSSDHRRSSQKDRRSSGTSRDDDRSPRRDKNRSGTDYTRFFEEVDRFIDSVDVSIHSEDFWWKMIDKWVQSA